MRVRSGIVAGVAGMLVASVSPVAAQSSCSFVETTTGPAYHEVFIIFFDSGSAAITPPAAAILANAANHYRPLSHCRMIVTTHTDRAGSEGANMRLSQRRGRAVVTYMRNLGVRAEARIDALGEARPLVETEDGVAEPQNRRAEILIGPRSEH